MRADTEPVEAQLASVSWQHARHLRRRLADVVIRDLQARKPFYTEDATYPQTLWDEYCWGLQEGFSDVPFVIGDRCLGSMADGWLQLINEHVVARCQAEPHETLVFMSFFANERALNSMDVLEPDTVCMEAIQEWVADEVRHRASLRDLRFIGPDRVDELAAELNASGFVLREVADRIGNSDLLGQHMDDLLDESADLMPLAEFALDLFMDAMAEELEPSSIGDALVREFNVHIRKLLLEQDILPALRDLRGQGLALVSE